jgi:hypothetical protein
MKLKKYDFFLLESILLTSPELKEMLNKIDDPVAKQFTDLIYKDIKTKYNILDKTDINSKLSFVSDNQATTKINSGTDKWALFSKSNNSTTIGRVVKSILSDNNIVVSDRDVDKFVDKFKAEFDKSLIKDKESPFKIVKGEDIRYWYLIYNYNENARSGNGSLGKSCMRYEECQKFLDIYVNNPDQVTMVILLNDDNKLLSRALLWKTNKGLYLDRIYYTNQSDIELVMDWVKENNTIYRMYNDERLEGNEWVSLKKVKYDYYPYMDTFKYYYITNGELMTEKVKYDDMRNLLLLESTSGKGEPQNKVYCTKDDEWYPEEQTEYSRYYNSHIFKQNAIWSKRFNSFLHRSYAYFSEHIDDNLPDEECNLVYIDNHGNTDYYPDDSDEVARNIDNNSYYLKTLLDEYNGKYVTKGKGVVLYKLTSETDLDYYYEIFHDSYSYVEKIDADVFGFKITDDQSKLFVKDEYMIRAYKSVLYNEMREVISNSSSPRKDEKLKELEEINTYLKSEYLDYIISNAIYDHGVKEIIDTTITWIRKVVNEEFEDYLSFIGISNRYNSFKNFKEIFLKYFLTLDYFKACIIDKNTEKYENIIRDLTPKDFEHTTIRILNDIHNIINRTLMICKKRVDPNQPNKLENWEEKLTGINIIGNLHKYKDKL